MTTRSRHLISYAAAMVALLLWQILFYNKGIQRLSDFDQDLLYSLGAQVLCMGIVPLLSLVILSKGRVKGLAAQLRYKAPVDKKTCALVTIGLILLITPFVMAFSAITRLIFQIIGYKRSFGAGMIYTGGGDFVISLCITALLPAVFEEFTHRGVLLSGLQSRGSEYSAVLISALMFSLMHLNPSQAIFTFFGGLVFAIVAVKFNSIIPAMCVHFANNAIAVFLDYSTQRKTAFGTWYDKISSNGNVLHFFLTFAVLVIALFGTVKLLQYAAKKAPKPVTPKLLFGSIPLDAFSPDGKALLKENAPLYATIIAEGLYFVMLLVWGIVK